MARILVVEDDEFLRSALRSLLESFEHKVTEAEDGLKAQDTIRNSPPFDLILSDIQMPRMTGVELLQWVKLEKPTNFILMTGFASLDEMTHARDLGADDFLAKPYRDEDLIEKINKWTNRPTTSLRTADDHYCKVSIGEFVSTPVLMFDVYVKLGAKYVKVGHKGEETPIHRIRGYRDKGLKFLYTTQSDFRQLVHFNVGLAKRVGKSASMDAGQRLQFLRYTGEIILEQVFTHGMDQEAMKEASEFLMSSMEIIREDGPAIDLLNALNAHADHLYAHSLCVSVYSGMIGRALGIESTQMLFNLAVAGLFHDIGMKEIPRELINKPMPLLTIAERQLYESHTYRGRDMLLALDIVPHEAVQVCYEHHEHNDGTGYPRAIKRFEIHQFAQIIRVADLFAEHSMKRPDGSPGMGAEHALTYLEKNLSEDLDPLVLKALRGLFAKPTAA